MKRNWQITGTLLFVAIILMAQAAPAGAITAEIAKKCRAMAIKAYPPKIPGSKKGTAQAERTYYQRCISNSGKASEEETPTNPNSTK